ncbi:hypothetical protein RRG08_021535 [Elysia crispata]|uniref:Uncharacterized protein n=1 Tax=Elysia crispata TaxID=231223 RepID=A0AAE1CEQ1_9GAST|nr:hypothetical protein RRG08_021535 [Elysia crispata]
MRVANKLSLQRQVEDGDQSFKSEEIPHTPKPTSNPLVPSVRKRKSTMNLEKAQLLSLAKARLTEQEDPYLSQTKTWANELKSMDRRQQLLAKKFINEYCLKVNVGHPIKSQLKSIMIRPAVDSANPTLPLLPVIQNNQGNEGVHFVQSQTENTMQQNNLARFFSNSNPNF